MTKKFTALLALTTISAAVQAQTGSVTVYGSVDQYIGHIRSDSGNSITGLNDGAILRTRLGFRGIEDLGGGYQAKFQMEGGQSADTGAMADSARLFDRQAWVGVNTPVGEFRFGRQNGPVQTIGGAIDYTERTTFGSIINSFGVPSRYNNDISYRTNRIGGFQLAVHYALAELAGESAGTAAVTQLGLDYAAGPYRVGYAGLHAKRPPGAAFDKNIVYHNAYGNYDYGQGKIYLAFVRSNNVTSSAAGATANQILSNTGGGVTNGPFTGAGTLADARRFYNVYSVSADYRITSQLRIGALWGKINDTSNGEAGAKGGNFGAFYDLSKRTTLYAFANYMKNEANAGFRFSGSAGPSANLSGADVNGRKLTGYQAGIRHVF